MGKYEIIKSTRMDAKTGRINSVSFILRRGKTDIGAFATLKDAKSFQKFIEKHPKKKLKKVM